MSLDPPIRIAVVIPKYGLVGGAERFAFNLTSRLARYSDFNISVITNRWHAGDAPITFHKVPIISFPRWLQPVSFAYFAQKAIQAGSYDIIHSHDRIFEMDLLTFHGIPHRTWINETKRSRLSLFDRAMAWVEQKAFNNPKHPRILPVSNLVKEEILKVYDIPESRIRTIHPGVALERFDALDRQVCRHEIRRQHGLAPEDVVVLFVSMNFELKRLDLVIKGIADAAPAENPNHQIKLLVVGKGDSKRFKAMANDLGILKNVIFAGVTHEVEKYYLASDIFAMPSDFDTFGLAVLEAMAAGLPVIITEKVGAGDLVESGINGIILSENPSVAEMAASLSTMVKKEKRLQMGASGRRVAMQYSWNNTAGRVAELYQELIKEKQRPKA